MRNIAKGLWSQYKNAWKAKPKTTGVLHVGGAGVLGGLYYDAQAQNAEEIAKSHKERRMLPHNYGTGSNEDWFDRAANKVRNFTNSIGLPLYGDSVHQELEYMYPGKQTYTPGSIPEKEHMDTWMRTNAKNLGVQVGRSAASFAGTIGSAGNSVFWFPAWAASKSLRAMGAPKVAGYIDKFRKPLYNEGKRIWGNLDNILFPKRWYTNIPPSQYYAHRALEKPGRALLDGVSNIVFPRVLAGGFGTFGKAAKPIVYFDEYTALPAGVAEGVMNRWK